MGIDLNSMEEEEEEEAAAPAVLLQPPTVCLELWHACAGPLISLPKKGSVVVYLPQGHLEHLAESTAAAYRHDLSPPQVFCRVVDVKLHVGLFLIYLSIIGDLMNVVLIFGFVMISG